ncbi:MAG TPA: UDP-N-acetylmuramate dehydrogenase, partial [Azonexus sp.]|nr:UDP-N-acetylmuramate dehydrogenase [Azonexus sp.]
GAARRVYIPADLEDMAWLVRSVPAHEDIHVVGLGSNLLVRDGGVNGVVILLHGVLKKLAIESRTHGLPPPPEDVDTALVYAQVGVATPKLARFSANHGLVGGEFWAGIPGTVGGAIAMNAGCYGGQTWDRLVQVQTLDRDGQLNERRPDEYVIGYRHVALKHTHEEWFIGGWFRLARGDGAASRETIKDLLKKRITAQPLSQPNAGSVFRNPPGDYAARLIEACGLKGFRIGDAQVSEKHANFIVNLGKATATDIERLIEHVEDSVEARTNVQLIREVRIIGERQ